MIITQLIAFSVILALLILVALLFSSAADSNLPTGSSNTTKLVDTYMNSNYKVELFKTFNNDSSVIYSYMLISREDDLTRDVLELQGILDCTASPSGIIVFDSYFSKGKLQRSWEVCDKTNTFTECDSLNNFIGNLYQDSNSIKVLSCQLPDEKQNIGVIASRWLNEMDNNFEYTVLTYKFKSLLCNTAEIVSKAVYGYSDSIRAYYLNNYLILVICDSSTGLNDNRIEIYNAVEGSVKFDKSKIVAQYQLLPSSNYSADDNDSFGEEVAGVGSSGIIVFNEDEENYFLLSVPKMDVKR